ncbi:S-adenosyl-L-methionine-dependent methyltransferase [Mycotypha africana]|uniref:S-adenosyl-L-methionine-dependent methyltransferase n=1 Tax=Mycotypha africana TaxID=64632 RepID=UPI0023005D2D|nr:S-adenosyl-L-methionine-dependent methyltransferase [Mycotypha africana]KAI8981684.1 S-adenosyl-L-methionine-dependent methyltransferase [Mycotypha africana]
MPEQEIKRQKLTEELDQKEVLENTTNQEEESTTAETAEYTAEELALGHELIAAVIANDLDKAKELLEKNVDLCFSGDELGRTPLHHAAECGHFDMVEWLLSEKHPYNLTDKSDITAGELALKNKHDKVYQRLVDEGVRSELLIRALKKMFGGDDEEAEKAAIANEAYLNQKLHYDDNKLMDENNDAVMMGWEGPLMVEHAKVMCPKEGLNVLNVGFGLGLIDTELQKYHPKNHYIIEAHPDVYAHMLELGWDKKPGVKILFGRWQDMLSHIDIAFDGIFFDTYGEFYDDLLAFHEFVPNMLNENGVYTWFNGLGATNQFFHDIYCNISEIDLREFGLSTEYIDMPISTWAEDGVWDGVRQKYWVLDTYKLPICKFLTE